MITLAAAGKEGEHWRQFQPAQALFCGCGKQALGKWQRTMFNCGSDTKEEGFVISPSYKYMLCALMSLLPTVYRKPSVRGIPRHQVARHLLPTPCTTRPALAPCARRLAAYARHRPVHEGTEAEVGSRAALALGHHLVGRVPHLGQAARQGAAEEGVGTRLVTQASCKAALAKLAWPALLRMGGSS